MARKTAQQLKRIRGDLARSARPPELIALKMRTHEHMKLNAENTRKARLEEEAAKRAQEEAKQHGLAPDGTGDL